MVHRRLFRDDGLGVGENLDEMEFDARKQMNVFLLRNFIKKSRKKSTDFCFVFSFLGRDNYLLLIKLIFLFFPALVAAGHHWLLIDQPLEAVGLCHAIFFRWFFVNRLPYSIGLRLTSKNIFEF
jgi:hypothetical protein